MARANPVVLERKMSVKVSHKHRFLAKGRGGVEGHEDYYNFVCVRCWDIFVVEPKWFWSGYVTSSYELWDSLRKLKSRW